MHNSWWWVQLLLICPIIVIRLVSIGFRSDSIQFVRSWIFIPLILNFLFLRLFLFSLGANSKGHFRMWFWKNRIRYCTGPPTPDTFAVCILQFFFTVRNVEELISFQYRYLQQRDRHTVYCLLPIGTEQITHIERYRPTDSYFVWLFFASIFESLLFCILFESFSRCLFIIFPFIRHFLPTSSPMHNRIQNGQWAYRKKRTYFTVIHKPIVP